VIPGAAPRELEAQAAGLVRAAVTGDTFAMDRIITRAHEDEVDWRSFATEVTYTAACLLVVSCGSKAQAAALVEAWLDGIVQRRLAAASLRRFRHTHLSGVYPPCVARHNSISCPPGASCSRLA
jgi:hypothetical protein